MCLPAQPGSPYAGVVSTVSGWGTLQLGGSQPSELMEVNLTTITNTECDVAHAAGDYTVDNYTYTVDAVDITASMICAKGDGKDSCQGDSGGDYSHLIIIRFIV